MAIGSNISNNLHQLDGQSSAPEFWQHGKKEKEEYSYSQNAIFEIKTHQIPLRIIDDLLYQNIHKNDSTKQIIANRDIAIQIDKESKQVESVRRVVRLSNSIFFYTLTAYWQLGALGLSPRDEAIVDTLENPQEVLDQNAGYKQYIKGNFSLRIFEPSGEIMNIERLDHHLQHISIKEPIIFSYSDKAVRQIEDLKLSIQSEEIQNVINCPKKVSQIGEMVAVYYGDRLAITINKKDRSVISVEMALPIQIQHGNGFITLNMKFTEKGLEEFLVLQGRYATTEDIIEAIQNPLRVIRGVGINTMYQGKKLSVLVAAQGFSIMGIRRLINVIDPIRNQQQTYCYSLTALKAIDNLEVDADHELIIDAILNPTEKLYHRDKHVIEFYNSTACVLIDTRDQTIMAVRFGIKAHPLSNRSNGYAPEFYQYTVSPYMLLQSMDIKLDHPAIRDTLENPLHTNNQRDNRTQFMGKQFSIIVDSEQNKIVSMSLVVHVEKYREKTTYYYTKHSIKKLNEYAMKPNDDEIQTALSTYPREVEENKGRYYAKNLIVVVYVPTREILDIIPCVEVMQASGVQRISIGKNALSQMRFINLDPFGVELKRNLTSPIEVFIKENQIIEYLSEEYAITVDQKNLEITDVRPVLHFTEANFEEKKRLFFSNAAIALLLKNGIAFNHPHIFSALINPYKIFDVSENQKEYRGTNISLVVDLSEDTIIGCYLVEPISMKSRSYDIQGFSDKIETRYIAYQSEHGDKQAIKMCLEEPDCREMHQSFPHLTKYIKNGVVAVYDSVFEKVVKVSQK